MRLPRFPEVLPSRRRDARLLPVLAASIATVLTVSACGGGGGDGATATPAAGGSPATVRDASVDPLRVTAVSSSALRVGETVRVAGTGLGPTIRFTVGGQVFEHAGTTGGEWLLHAPGVPVSGVLRIEDGSGVAVDTAFTLSVYEPLSVDAVSPSIAPAGAVIEIGGRGLDEATTVLFPGGGAGTVLGPVPGAAVGTRLRVQVPATAAGTGPLVLVSTLERIVTSQLFTASLEPSLESVVTFTDGGRVNVVVKGANLDRVSEVRPVSESPGDPVPDLSVLRQSANELVVSVQAPFAGSLSLQGPGTSPKQVSLLASRQAAFTAGELRWGQAFDVAGTPRTHRISQDKPLWVRVPVLASVEGVSSPAVQVTVTGADGAVLGRFTANGPATLPVAALETELGSTFNVLLPASVIRPGITVTASTDGIVGTGLRLAQAGSPPVTGRLRLPLVIVPIAIGGVAPRVPSVETVRAMLARVYPYPADAIDVSVRATWSPATAASLPDYDALAGVLQDLESLRQAEAPQSYYYGLVPDAAMTAVGVAGIGYLPSLEYADTGAVSALGRDAASAAAVSDPFGDTWQGWQQVMLHELGHNHGRGHAPCGAPVNADAAYPYPEGRLGLAALLRSHYLGTEDATVAAPVVAGPQGGTVGRAADVMGYCGGVWFSDYNYGHAQDFAEVRTARLAASGAGVPGGALALAKSTDAELAYLSISGTLRAGEARIDRVGSFRSSQARQTLPLLAATHRVRVRTVAGETIDVPVRSQSIPHAPSPGDTHFFAVLRDPGPIESISLVRAGPTAGKATTETGAGETLATIKPAARPASLPVVAKAR